MDVKLYRILYKTVLLFETSEVQPVIKVGSFSIACIRICAQLMIWQIIYFPCRRS